MMIRKKYLLSAFAMVACLGFYADQKSAKETIAEHRFTQSEMDEIVSYVPIETVQKVKNELGSATPNAYVYELAKEDESLNTVLCKKYNIKFD